MTQYARRAGETFGSGRQTRLVNPHRGLLWRLSAMIAGSIAFTIALVPLYDVLCQKAGLNGRAAEDLRGGGFESGAAATSVSVDRGRIVTVEFTGTVMPGLPWQMRPLTRSVTIHPGELEVVRYQVRNLSDETVSWQAIPGITPGQAARYFHKIECFCFAHQSLGPYEEREMAVVFVIRPDLDPEVSQLTMAYAFFPLATAHVAALMTSPALQLASRS
jgi:cytochrome c oxidase assembly protein subunit 11